jgi:hypothetical protein
VNVRQVRDPADGVELFGASLFLQLGLELEVAVEMFFDRAFALADDHEDIRHAGTDGFLDDMLNRRGVDDGQHLLGLRLGGGQEPGAETGGGNDGFADGVGLMGERLGGNDDGFDDFDAEGTEPGLEGSKAASSG